MRQWRAIRVSRPDVNERFLRAARNPATVRALLGFNTLAPIKDVLIDIPSEFVLASDIPLYVYQDGDYEWMYGLTPRYLTLEKREDIVGNIIVELMERRIDRAGVPACAKRMIAACNKENPMKAYGDIHSPLPLDAPAYLDGTMTRVEIVSEPIWS